MVSSVERPIGRTQAFINTSSTAICHPTGAATCATSPALSVNDPADVDRVFVDCFVGWAKPRKRRAHVFEPSKNAWARRFAPLPTLHVSLPPRPIRRIALLDASPVLDQLL